MLASGSVVVPDVNYQLMSTSEQEYSLCLTTVTLTHLYLFGHY